MSKTNKTSDVQRRRRGSLRASDDVAVTSRALATNDATDGGVNVIVRKHHSQCRHGILHHRAIEKVQTHAHTQTKTRANTFKLNVALCDETAVVVKRVGFTKPFKSKSSMRYVHVDNNTNNVLLTLLT